MLQGPFRLQQVDADGLLHGPKPAKTNPACGRGRPRRAGRISLCQTDLFRLQTLRPTLHYKRHFRAFIERAVPRRLDSGKMDEDVFAILTLDKTKSLGCVEPLHRTGFFHVSLFLLCDHFPHGSNENDTTDGRASRYVQADSTACKDCKSLKRYHGDMFEATVIST
jgi:hypothetical protein